MVILILNADAGNLSNIDLEGPFLLLSYPCHFFPSDLFLIRAAFAQNILILNANMQINEVAAGVCMRVCVHGCVCVCVCVGVCMGACVYVGSMCVCVSVECVRG